MLRNIYGLEEDRKTISIFLSREDIASLSSMTTSNAIRTLSNFASEGIISLKGRRISLNDQTALEHISELG
jgi:CRP-like cAMP-binding protein